MVYLVFVLAAYGGDVVFTYLLVVYLRDKNTLRCAMVVLAYILSVENMLKNG